MTDESGQLLVISGFIMAMGLVVLSIMLNSTIYMNNTAYEGSMDTHYKDILYLNDLTTSEAQNAYSHSYIPVNFDPDLYKTSMDNYFASLKQLAAYKGISISIISSTCVHNPSTSTGVSTIEILYSDSDTVSQYTLTTNVKR